MGAQTDDDVQEGTEAVQAENIVGADGVTYPSVISQPIYDAKAMNWDSPPEDMEYEVFYLINFEYGMDPILVFLYL